MARRQYFRTHAKWTSPVKRECRLCPDTFPPIKGKVALRRRTAPRPAVAARRRAKASPLDGPIIYFPPGCAYEKGLGAPASEPGLSHAAAGLPSRMPMDMWTIGFADRLRLDHIPTGTTAKHRVDVDRGKVAAMS